MRAAAAAVLAAGILLPSCSSSRRAVTAAEDGGGSVCYVVVRDSVMTLDSVYIRTSDTVYVHGDTVTETRWRERVRSVYCGRVDRDTVTVRDTVVATVHDMETVEAERGVWSRVKEGMFYPLAIALLGVVTYLYIERRDA